MIEVGSLHAGTAASNDADGADGHLVIDGHRVDAGDGAIASGIVDALAALGLAIDALAPVPDSCGAGRTRGGAGVELKLRAKRAVEVCIRFSEAAPEGHEAGLDGGHADALQLRDGMVRFYLASTGACEAVLQAGDVLVLRSAGGGGCGLSLDRSPDRVAADVLSGRVSAQGALFWYGVTVDAETLQLDVPATLRHRATLKAALRLPSGVREQMVTELTQDALARAHPDQAMLACMLPGCCTPRNPFLSRGAR